jgi:hypothetical protein
MGQQALVSTIQEPCAHSGCDARLCAFNARPGPAAVGRDGSGPSRPICPDVIRRSLMASQAGRTRTAYRAQHSGGGLSLAGARWKSTGQVGPPAPSRPPATACRPSPGLTILAPGRANAAPLREQALSIRTLSRSGDGPVVPVPDSRARIQPPPCTGQQHTHTHTLFPLISLSPLFLFLSLAGFTSTLLASPRAPLGEETHT